MIAAIEPGAIFPREFLKRALESRRISHAYLFVGPASSGKRDVALEFSRRLFCEAGGDCRRCGNCRRIDHGNHAGVTVYAPGEGRTVFDIDTVRDVCERSHFSRDHAFVAILEGADRLTVPAANALLKTLEEPPGEFILILLAASTGSLLPTIVSRCHRLYFAATLEHGAEERVDSEVLAELAHEDFFARTDPGQWLARVVPSVKGSRERLRELTLALLARYRGILETVSGAQLDHHLETLELLLDLGDALEGNVNPDLVLEKLVNRLTPA